MLHTHTCYTHTHTVSLSLSLSRRHIHHTHTHTTQILFPSLSLSCFLFILSLFPSLPLFLSLPPLSLRLSRALSLSTASTGWRRLIGSPKLQIIFHKRATKYRSFLRKMTYKDKGSYESSPPCTTQQDGKEPLFAGSRRPIGCLKMQVIFRERATNYRALLQKMTYKDKAFYASSPPCYTTIIHAQAHFLYISLSLSHTHTHILSLCLSLSRALFFSLPLSLSLSLSLLLSLSTASTAI